MLPLCVAIRTIHPETEDPDQRVWLFALAAPREFDAALVAFGYHGDRPEKWRCVRTQVGIDLVWTGVGKANAAGASAKVIAPDRHKGVVSVGIAGALPGSKCNVGDVVCAGESVFADEGVCTPDGFQSCAQMGFSAFDDASDSKIHAPETVEWLGLFADHNGSIACVSMCSGTDEAASAVASRSGAIAEAMEGAAVALAASRVDATLLTGELRVISNTTGDRAHQQWDLEGSLQKLGEVLGRIADGI